MSRKAFPGSKLVRDAERLLAHDRASPPEARPTLMDAIRELQPFVEARAGLGWTDTMIARLLTEAGYPISAGTLRSYRKRLRDERTTMASGAATARDSTEETASGGLRKESDASLPRSLQEIDGVEHVPAPAPAPMPSTAHNAGLSDPARARTFRVKGTNLPRDRA